MSLLWVMEQIQGQVFHNPFALLDTAAKETTTALARVNIRHGFTGGYATYLISGMRVTAVGLPYIFSIFDMIPSANVTLDLDIIIYADPSDARTLLLQAHSEFKLSESNKLVFTAGNKSIPIELLRGGSTRQLKLPDANGVPILYVTVNDRPGRIGHTPIPIVAPSVLVLTKIKRWTFLAESTRPKTIRKAEKDVQDIQVLLNWLSRNNLHLDFGYPEKPKGELLSGVRKLYQMHAAICPLLETTLDAEVFALINN